MTTRINLADELRMTIGEDAQRPRPARREPHALPNFVNAAGIALIACQNVFATHPQPTGDPDFNGIALRQRARSAEGGRARRGRWTDETRHHGTKPLTTLLNTQAKDAAD